MLGTEWEINIERVHFIKNCFITFRTTGEHEIGKNTGIAMNSLRLCSAVSASPVAVPHTFDHTKEPQRGGSEVKNPPANARDMGSIPGLRSFHGG